MPIYEYKCRKNGHVFEVRQGFNDPEVAECTTCQSPVDRLVSASAFHLKGSGWYTTDYKAPSTSSTPSVSSSSSGGSSSETKVAEAPSGGGCHGGACGAGNCSKPNTSTKKE